MNAVSDPFSTRFTRLIGCRLPVQLAAMGGVSTPALAGAVAGCGGLGMLAAAGLSADDLDTALSVARATAGPSGRIGVGFLMPFLDRDAWALAASGSDLVEGFYGEIDPALIGDVHAGGALAAWQVGSIREAQAALDAGCDVIVVQGVEAGGHVRGGQPLDELLGAIRAVTTIPLVAAGGIGTGARATELLDAGADAVRIGTRFLATDEADVHPNYARALIAATADDTVVTETFALAWPNAPHRVLRSSVDASDADPSTRIPLPPTRAFTGDVASAALYAGRSVDAVSETTTVAAVMSEFEAELASRRRAATRPEQPDEQQPPVQVTGLDHVVFVVPDVDAAVAFYRDVLGLTVEGMDRFLDGRKPFCSVRVAPDVLIDLLPGERTGENVNHVALVIAGDVDELAASGRIPVERGPSDLSGALGTGRGIYVRDPAGNLIELRSYS